MNCTRYDLKRFSIQIKIVCDLKIAHAISPLFHKMFLLYQFFPITKGVDPLFLRINTFCSIAAHHAFIVYLFV